MLKVPNKDYVGLEEYYYIGKVHSNGAFGIQLAGLTKPDPKYFIYHPKSKLWVFEYVISGSGYIVTENATHFVKSGDFYIIPEYCDCYYHSDFQDPFEKVWINLTGNLVRHIMSDYEYGNTVQILSVNAKPYFDRIFAFLKQDPVDYINVHLAFHEMIARIAKPTADYSKDGIIEGVHDYLLNNISNNVEIDEICKIFYVSRVHLSQLFKKKYGVSPYRFFVESKLKVAADMLVNTDLPIKKIAFSLAYLDPHHFSNAFNKHYGCSPKEYRRKMKKE